MQLTHLCDWVIECDDYGSKGTTTLHAWNQSHSQTNSRGFTEYGNETDMALVSFPDQQ